MLLGERRALSARTPSFGNVKLGCRTLRVPSQAARPYTAWWQGYARATVGDAYHCPTRVRWPALSGVLARLPPTQLHASARVRTVRAALRRGGDGRHARVLRAELGARGVPPLSTRLPSCRPRVRCQALRPICVARAVLHPKRRRRAQPRNASQSALFSLFSLVHVYELRFKMNVSTAVGGRSDPKKKMAL